jgi:hypothetical protein
MDTPASKTTHSFQRATWSLRWGIGLLRGRFAAYVGELPGLLGRAFN